ncbi:MAG TPA: OsmC family protein, partial [Ktedonobacteraceae bacterium]
TARVHFNPVPGGFAINPIDLETEAVVPGIDEETFQKLAKDAKENCPVSKALAATPINLTATLTR